jgi:hypothetical protein
VLVCVECDEKLLNEMLQIVQKYPEQRAPGAVTWIRGIGFCHFGNYYEVNNIGNTSLGTLGWQLLHRIHYDDKNILP